jgi:hypothetical protein
VSVRGETDTQTLVKLQCLFAVLIVSGGYIHLRVKEASGRLYDSDSLMVDRDRNQHAFAVLQNDNELQAEALRMQVGGEGVGNRLLGARRDLDRIAP